MSKEYNSAQIFSCEDDMQVRCSGACQDHLFSLARSSGGIKCRTPVEIRFCPFLDKTKSVAENVWPEVNFDGKPHLPSFVMGVDKIPMLLSQKNYLEAFSKKLEESLGNPVEILEPHPGLDKKKCGVCGCIFKDYRTHIRTRVHKFNISKSLFQPDIHQLSKPYLQTSKTSPNQNHPIYIQRLRSFKKALRSEPPTNDTLSLRSSFKVQSYSIESKEEHGKTEETRGRDIDRQLETMTLKKSEEKTNLCPNSIC